jgi:hypothetical protein
MLRIFPVEFPAQGVVQDIFPDAIQFVRAPNHVFVKRALPDWDAWSSANLVDIPRRKCFERPYDFRQTMPFRMGGFKTRPYKPAPTMPRS